MGTFSEWLKLSEMPMQLNKVGDWDKPHERGAWDEKSYRAFNSQSALGKIERLGDKTLHNFNVYVIRDSQRGAFSASGANVPMAEADRLYKSLQVSPQEAPLDPNKVNVFLVSWNDEPPTAWMILHRFAHMASTLYTWEANNAIQKFIKAADGSNQQIMAFQSVLTMRSARMGQIDVLEEGIREALAQFLMAGKVTLQPRNNWARFVDAPGLQAELNRIFTELMQKSHQYIYVM